MFIRNCWYVAAWPHEVTDKPLARTLLAAETAKAAEPETNTDALVVEHA